MYLQFTKMHGLGNDFVVMDNMNGRISLTKEQIIFLCDRHKGVGADGVILVEASDKADCYMNYYNSDGSVGICGNGTRCTTKFLKEEVLSKNNKQTNFKIDTCAGIKDVELMADGTFSVNMGKAVFLHTDFPDKPIELEGLTLNFVSVGNPHAIAFVDDVDQYDLLTIGPSIENNKNFPNKINVELVEEKNKKEFKVVNWERGSGLTLACGSGACAVYAAVREHRNADKKITINLPGGDLLMSENESGDIMMRGPAEAVYTAMVHVE